MLEWGIFIPATALFFILYFHFFNKLFNGKKVIYKIEIAQELRPFKFEILYTCISLILFLLVGVFLGYSIDNGWTVVYHEVGFSALEIIYLISSLFIALIIHDIYFYLIHRFLHIKIIYKYVHSWHHKTHNTNAWAAFSFHPIEGVLQIGIVPIIAYFLPLQIIVLFLFTSFLLFMSVYGHSGYELRANKLKVLNIFNTSLHHFQHHKFINYNYGIYFNICDRLFSTNHPEYFNAVKKIGNRIIDDKKKISDPNLV
ncbi:MAG: sterol desaturase family protein [Cyclobacteriaceae bacterium]|nr:sterol desaturase family protein [Cyclobacteriaceae bacterium]